MSPERLRRDRTSRLHEMVDEVPVRFIGGMRYRNFNASWPLAELQITEGTVRVQLRAQAMRRLLGRWLPSVEIELDGTRAEPIRGFLPGSINRGVRFVSAANDGTELIFWCSQQAALLDSLRERGAQIGKPDGVL
jgi:hypothetical protein